MEIAVIGNEDFATGFRLAGVRRIEVAGPGQVEQRLSGLVREKEVGIVVVHESDYQRLDPRLKKELEKMATPIVVRLSERASDDLQKLMKKSFGVDLWKKKE